MNIREDILKHFAEKLKAMSAFEFNSYLYEIYGTLDENELGFIVQSLFFMVIPGREKSWLN